MVLVVQVRSSVMCTPRNLVLLTRDGNSSLRLGLESHLSRINKDLGLDLDS